MMRFFPPSKLQTREFNWGMLTLLSTDRCGRTTPSLCAGGTCGRKPLQTRESIRECWHHHQQTGVVEADSHCAPVEHVVENHSNDHLWEPQRRKPESQNAPIACLEDGENLRSPESALIQSLKSMGGAAAFVDPGRLSLAHPGSSNRRPLVIEGSWKSCRNGGFNGKINELNGGFPSKPEGKWITSTEWQNTPCPLKFLHRMTRNIKSLTLTCHHHCRIAARRCRNLCWPVCPSTAPGPFCYKLHHRRHCMAIGKMWTPWPSSL